ncbi:MAG: molybdopterin-containing oxidoreductase family protein [Gammaproteobacteria bacterium]
MLDKTEKSSKKVTCAMCDMACQLEGRFEGSQLVGIHADDTHPLTPGAICIKAANALEYYSHPDRLLHPLKRIGRRGSGEWEQVSWDQALDEIATKLKALVGEHGPETVALTSNSWNTSVESGSIRRFMNLLGTPNYISGVSMCAGNTAAVSRMVCGWFPSPDFERTNLVVLGGHVPTKNNWSAMYVRLSRALERGAKMIVLDPRENPHVKNAAIWLPLHAGTDAAMYMGWIKYILDEGLYDKAFVDNWTVGLEQLRERLEEYPLERVAKITGVNQGLIEQAARLYAEAGPAVIPWVPMLDKQHNSTSAIRAQNIMRAVCGYLDVPGGELLSGFSPDVLTETDFELHERLPQEQKDKQLRQSYNAFTYEGQAALREPTKRVYGREYANLITGCYMAHPPSVFDAMITGAPYPVKAFFVTGNNPLMSYANQTKVYQAIMNQELVVTFDLFKSPTAQLSDYILPGNSWLERDHLHDFWGWTNASMISHKLQDAPGECRGGYDLWKGLADRMGFGDEFPWGSTEEVYSERVKGLGMNWDEFKTEFDNLYVPEYEFRKYEQKGFATPSGKVELYSQLLADLGHDPLPYFVDRDDPKDMPFRLFIGIRDDPYFHTAQRQVKKFRQNAPYPEMFMCAEDVETHGLNDGDWYDVTSPAGSISLKLKMRNDIPKGVIRVPRGWWIPEMDEGGEILSGAWLHADAILVPDTPEFMDREQGVVDMTRIPCKVSPSHEPEWVPKAKELGFIKPELASAG